MIKQFKWNRNDKNDQYIIDKCIEAINSANLKFDYVIRTLGSSETTALKSAKLRPLAIAIADAVSAKYLPRLLKKKKVTTPLHRLPDLASRKAEMDGVFEIEVKKRS